MTPFASVCAYLKVVKLVSIGIAKNVNANVSKTQHSAPLVSSGMKISVSVFANHNSAIFCSATTGIVLFALASVNP